MLCWNQDIVEKGKTIVCGHWYTSFGHSMYHNEGIDLFDTNSPEEYSQVIFDPFIDDGIVAIDATTAISNKVNCYVFEVN